MDTGCMEGLSGRTMICVDRPLPWRYPLQIIAVLALVFSLTACGVPSPAERIEVGFRGLYSGHFDQATNHMVLGSIHHGGSLWSLHPPAREYNWNHQANQYSEILYSALSADGRIAVTADYHNLAVWDGETGSAMWFWSAPARINALALSADGQTVMLGLGNGNAVLFDAIEGGVLRELPHESPILSVAMSADGRLGITGTEGLSAHLWDLTTLQPVRSFLLPNQVPLVGLSGDGALALIAPARETAVLWDTEADALAFELNTDSYRLYSARFADTQLLVGTTHRRIMAFDLATGQRSGQWQVGRFLQNAFQSTTVLDMNWHDDRLWAIGSDGFLYGF
ncbi:MAG: WD40 repeat domain-containing protein [Saccharospirillum sp.]